MPSHPPAGPTVDGPPDVGRPDAYDPIADVYDRFWGDVLAPTMLAALDRMLPAVGDVRSAASGAAPPPRLLDLCCGTGQLAAGLLARGWDVVGIDGSGAMLERARRRAPGAVFVQADARAFDAAAVSGGAPFDAVVCAFDSLNHLPDAASLTDTFRCVSRALRPGGRFVFDLNTREGFEERFNGSFGFAADDLACVVTADFDGQCGRYAVTVFRPAPDDAYDRTSPGAARTWQRTEATLVQRCFEIDAILSALADAGFGDPTVLDAEDDLGMDGHVGRAVFLVDRPFD